MLLIVRVVGWDAYEHLVEDAAEEVPVHGLAVAASLQHLGGQVGGGTAETTRLRVM